MASFKQECCGCGKMVSEEELSDVMEMCICKKCENIHYCEICCMETSFDEEDNCKICCNHISQELSEKDEEIQNLAEENKNMETALAMLGFTLDQITSICYGSFDVICNKEEDELETFTCDYCGCDFQVQDRDSFDCPNCDSFKMDQTIEKLKEVGFILSDNLKQRDEKILEYAEQDGEITTETFFDFINDNTEWNTCDHCGKVENSECLIWTELNEEQKAQKFFNNNCAAVCRECYEKPICIYCESLEQRNELHFACEICGNGMCNDCYDNMTEHDGHYHLPLENCDSELEIKAITKACNNDNPDYICESCMSRVLANEFKEHSERINTEILKGSGIQAEIFQAIEYFGENDDSISEDDPDYMQPMCEGYLMDIKNKEEIDGTRTGCYCSLELVVDELEQFAKDRKIAYIAHEIKKLVNTRWENKQDLENHLKKTFAIDTKLEDVDESGLVCDYAFIGGIFEHYGYMDIYYLKVPYGDETIHITEVKAVAE